MLCKLKLNLCLVTSCACGSLNSLSIWRDFTLWGLVGALQVVFSYCQFSIYVITAKQIFLKTITSKPDIADIGPSY